MRSKRVLTLLVAVCMIVSLFAPTVSAVTTGEQNGVNASAGNKNDLLISSDGIQPSLTLPAPLPKSL